MRGRGYLAVGIVAGCLGALAWVLARPNAVVPGVVEAPRVAGTRLFENVLTHVRSFGVDSIEDEELYRRAAAGVVEELDDPYAVLLMPGQRIAQNDEPGPQGLFLDRQDGLVVVVATAVGSAAESAGVRSGDRLVLVDSVPIDGARLDQVERLLEGAPGTRVTIRVRRDGERATIPLAIVRSNVSRPPAVESSALPGGAGRVRVWRFIPGVADSVRGRIEVLRAGGARSLVLDLRRAVGGQLADGVALADLFLDAGRKIAASRGREHSATANFVDSTASPFDSIPLAVLVDAGTAGAGEVVAGALQDNDRAAVLGAITFGRGVTQSTFALADGASVRLTTALWMTPRGRQIQRPPNPADGGPTDGSPADGRSVAGNPVPRPKFRSAGGRVLLGGGGIVPDRLVTDTGLADLTLGGARSLLGKAATTRGILALVTDR